MSRKSELASLAWSEVEDEKRRVRIQLATNAVIALCPEYDGDFISVCTALRYATPFNHFRNHANINPVFGQKVRNILSYKSASETDVLASPYRVIIYMIGCIVAATRERNRHSLAQISFLEKMCEEYNLQEVFYYYMTVKL